MTAKLRFWHELAMRQHKLFAIEGFEDEADLAIASEFAADVLQGYYFGRPQLLSTSN